MNMKMLQKIKNAALAFNGWLKERRQRITMDGALPLVDEAPKYVNERIKTFEDACEWCKENGFTGLVETFDNANEWVDNESKDVFAYLKLRIIVAALNEGWQPQFTEDEYRWYPWYRLYTRAEMDDMDEERRKRLRLFGGHSSDGSYCSIASAPSTYAWSHASAHVSACLALKSEELASYCGGRFIDIWADYILCA